MHDRTCYGRLSPAAVMRSQQVMWAGYTEVKPKPTFLYISSSYKCRALNSGKALKGSASLYSRRGQVRQI